MSGGGVFHHGPLDTLNGSTFLGNTAGIEGPAVTSVGFVESMFNSTFIDNSFYCPKGYYGYDEDSEAEEVILL